MHFELGNAWLSAVLTAFDQAVIGTTLQDTIVIWNDGAQRLLGYSPQEAIGRPRSMLSLGGESIDIRAFGEELDAPGQGSLRDVALRCKDGSIRPVTASLFPVFDTAGHVGGVIEIIRADLPEQGQSAAQIATVTRLTHELSESITAIGNYLLGAKILLSRGAQPDRMKLEAAIEDALTQVSRATDTFQRLRAFAFPAAADKELH